MNPYIQPTFNRVPRIPNSKKIVSSRNDVSKTVNSHAKQ